MFCMKNTAYNELIFIDICSYAPTSIHNDMIHNTFYLKDKLEKGDWLKDFWEDLG